MLLQGDELSVQLFIGAAALTALSVAMTQAGWTHKWFVRGISVSSIGWPLIQLARQDLLDRYQYVGKQISDILDERLPLERRLTELETPGPIVSALERSEIAQEYARLSAQRDATRKNRRNGFRPPKIVAKLCDQILRLNCAKGICSQRDFWLRIDREL